MWCCMVWCGVVLWRCVVVLWCCGVVLWCCSVLWCGVVWCGVVCCVVWCGVVLWCGVVWCGVAAGAEEPEWRGSGPSHSSLWAADTVPLSSWRASAVAHIEAHDIVFVF